MWENIFFSDESQIVKYGFLIFIHRIIFCLELGEMTDWKHENM